MTIFQDPKGADKTSFGNLKCVHDTLVHLLSGNLSTPVYHLASFDPGTGKTAALCEFLKAWKSQGFRPTQGALIVLSTRKEIEDCIARSSLDPADFAILVAKGHQMNEEGRPNRDRAPVLFTTQEKLRRLCDGMSFADVEHLHFLGQPRRLRVWDEAFLPAPGETFRKDTILSPLEDLRPVSPPDAASLDALGDSLSADSVGRVVQVPEALKSACTTLSGLPGHGGRERWRPLRALAGQEALVVHGGGNGLYLAGAGNAIPADFAPALILDASGRVRETYKAMDANGILRRLPSVPRDYSPLRIHHWDRAASRSTLANGKARSEVLQAAAEIINGTSGEEPWLVIHPKLRASDGYDIFGELAALVDGPERLTSLHWGDHHGTNDHRHLSRVMVLGLWHFRRPAYAALHAASGAPLDLAGDRATLDVVEAGEHRHNLLQAICRASVRQGDEETCGACEVHLVGRLGADGDELLRETFPGVVIERWTPASGGVSGSVARLILELEKAFAVPGVVKVQKAAVRAALGYKSTQALAKVIQREEFRDWADRRGLVVTTRAFELREG